MNFQKLICSSLVIAGLVGAGLAGSFSAHASPARKVSQRCWDFAKNHPSIVGAGVCGGLASLGHGDPAYHTPTYAAFAAVGGALIPTPAFPFGFWIAGDALYFTSIAYQEVKRDNAIKEFLDSKELQMSATELKKYRNKNKINPYGYYPRCCGPEYDSSQRMIDKSYLSERWDNSEKRFVFPWEKRKMLEKFMIEKNNEDLD